MDPHKRSVQTSVTCFLHCGDEYLFLLRAPDKTVDANRLNGIGGRVEPGENYLDAAIRETMEETGYAVTPEDMMLSGIVRLEGGYEEDWIMCFFRIDVPSKQIPIGENTPDGKLMWLPSSEVLTAPYELVDDLHYCFGEIVAGKNVFFASARVGSDEKIREYRMGLLPVSG